METIHERIHKRRLELGLSVIDVAKSLGVSRATVYRYENKEIEKLPFDVIKPLAKALHTTPEYLMGWEEPTEPPASSDLHITVTTEWGPAEAEDYRAMLECYKDLSEEDKKKIRSYIEFLSQHK